MSFGTVILATSPGRRTAKNSFGKKRAVEHIGIFSILSKYGYQMKGHLLSNIIWYTKINFKSKCGGDF